MNQTNINTMAKTETIAGVVPVPRGPYDSGNTYYKYNLTQLYGSTYMSKIDDNTTAPATMDAEGNITLNENWEVWADASGIPALQKEIKKRYKTIGFAGSVDDTIMPASTTGEGNSGNVYFSTNLKCFCLKKGESYFTRWDNSSLWNDKADTDSPVAYSDCYYINEGKQYVFDGTVLKIVGGREINSLADLFYKNGRVHQVNGEIASAEAGFYITPFIPVTAGDTITVAGYSGGKQYQSYSLCCLYDKDKKFIESKGNENESGGQSNVTFVVPENAAYMVCGSRDGYLTYIDAKVIAKILSEIVTSDGVLNTIYANSDKIFFHERYLNGGLALNTTPNKASAIDIDLTNANSYVEIKYADLAKGIDSNNIQFLYKEGGYNANYYLDGQFWLRVNSVNPDDYVKWNLPGGADKAKLNVVKILHKGGNILELFFNGKSCGEKQVKYPAIFNRIGGANVPSEKHIAYIKYFDGNNEEYYGITKLYFSAIDKENLKIIPYNELEEQVVKNSEFITRLEGFVFDEYFGRLNADDAYNSRIEIAPQVTLSDVGDSVEVYCRFYSDERITYKNATFLVNRPPNNIATFGYYSENSIGLRLEDLTWNFITITEIPREWHAIKLEKSITGYKLYIDGIEKGEFPTTSPFPIDLIGAINPDVATAEYAQKYDIKWIKINTQSAGEINIKNIVNYDKAYNITPVKTTPENSNATANPICLVTYSKENNFFKVYMRDEQKYDTYYMICVQLASSLGTPAHEIYYQHLWEINNYSKKCTFAGGKMYEGEQLISAGESEFVWKEANKIDFTGGVHGDERIDVEDDTFVKFYIDGVMLSEADLLESFELRPCNCFHYIQRSSMHL